MVLVTSRYPQLSYTVHRSGGPPSLGPINCRVLHASMALTKLSKYDLVQSVFTDNPSSFTCVQKQQQVLKATCLPCRKCYSLMVDRTKEVFQGKLCFPPLPSTISYRIISSFTPLNTEVCHTTWIMTLLYLAVSLNVLLERH